MIDQIDVSGGQAPAPQHGVCGNQSIEGIPGPDKVRGAEKPRCGGRVVEQPAVILPNRRHRGRVDANAPGLVEELQLEQGCRGHIEPAPILG